MKTRIALIYGGEGHEHEISLSSASTVAELLDKEKYELLPILITKGGEWTFANGGAPTYPVYYGGKSGFLSDGGIIECEAALPILHGECGEDGKIQGALETARIKFVGCKTLAGAVCSDKILTRAVADSLGIPGARWIYATKCDPLPEAVAEAERRLSYPMFVKPSGLGSSIGAGAARDRRELFRAITEARDLSRDGRILIEELVPIKYEIECAYFDDGTPLFSASGVIDTGGSFYDFSRKYSNPDGIKISHGRLSDEKIKSQAESYARSLARALDLCGMARIDFFLTEEGDLYFNEINTVPGMTKTSLYPYLCEDAGVMRDKIMERLLATLL